MGETAFPVEDPYLLSPATQIRAVFVEEISDPELVSKGVGEGPPVPLEGTQSPDLYTSSCLSPVLEQDFTKLWHPSPGLPANSTHARGGLQSQVTGFVREKN